MPDAIHPLAEVPCLNCGRELRAGAQFCAACGCTNVASPKIAVTPRFVGTSGNFESHWRKIKWVGLLFALLLASTFVLGILGRFSSSPWLEPIVSGIDAVVILGFAGLQRRDILPLLRPPQLNGRSALELIGLALASFVLLNGYFALIGWIGFPTIRVSTDYQKVGWGLGPMLLLISLMPGIFEELAFRGVIQSTLEHVFDRREALVIQAALFSVLHLLPLDFPSHFVMGLCLGYMRLRTKSLYPGMILHASWNAFILCQELYG
jgi:membrane protease YdiL (CAAX protease family)